MDHWIVDREISTEYKEGIEYFYDLIFENEALLHQGQACCLYNRYDNREIFDRDIITIHLYKSGFMPDYKYWYLHGETWEKVARVRTEQDIDTDRMIDMVMDADGLKFN